MYCFFAVVWSSTDVVSKMSRRCIYRGICNLSNIVGQGQVSPQGAPEVAKITLPVPPKHCRTLPFSHRPRYPPVHRFFSAVTTGRRSTGRLWGIWFCWNFFSLICSFDISVEIHIIELLKFGTADTSADIFTLIVASALG